MLAKSILISLAVAILSNLAGCRGNQSAPASRDAVSLALLTPGPASDAGWDAASFDGLQLIKMNLDAEIRDGADDVARGF